MIYVITIATMEKTMFIVRGSFKDPLDMMLNWLAHWICLIGRRILYINLSYMY